MFKLLTTKLSLSRSAVSGMQMHTTSMLNFRFTPVLFAEPLKKKRKIDPAVVKAREERRRKKLEKQIKRLEKNARQLKPIDELEVPLTLIDEKNKRSRKLPQISEQEQERRAVLMKKWSHYRMEENLKDFKILDKVVAAQTKALQELRFESAELYQEAIQPDMSMIPFVAKGPVSTPPVKEYSYIDGDFIDITKKYDGESK